MVRARAALPRLTVVHCPQWPVVAAGCAADEAVAVVHANRVVARSVVAAAAGVRIGQRRREAQARCPHVRLVAHEPLVDARAFSRVAEAVATIVPRLEISRPGVLTFATRGPSRYFGGDLAMAQRVGALVAETVQQVTGTCGVGIADGRFAAGVAARHASHQGHPQVVAPGGSPMFLAPLALRWLHDVGDIESDQVHLLARLGLRSLGDLAALPEPDVLARFGWQGVAARRMASGTDDRPPGSEDPPPGLTVDHHFETPVQHLDAVVFAGRQLVEQLIGSLAVQGRVCTQFAATAETEYGERCERIWSLSTGFAVTTMIERIRWQLDGWARADTGTDADCIGSASSGVVHLRLEPTEVRADDGVQLGLWGGRTQADDWARRAATRLAGMVGDDRVVVAEWRGGRQPADLYRFVPASLSSTFEAGAPAGMTSGAAMPSAGQMPWPGRLPAPSPAVVYPDPQPVEVVDAEGLAVAVSGRGAISSAPVAVRGAPGIPTVTIAAWAGPWLLDERWWDAARHRRLARFQLLSSDGRAFLATIERRQWWLVAEYA